MRLAALRRHATPVAVALPIAVAGLLAGHGPLPTTGGEGSTVTTRVQNGPLGAQGGASDPLEVRLTGAHPVTHETGTVVVQQAVARTDTPSADVSDTALPAHVLAAYRHAAALMGRSDPGCALRWPLLAGIGRVESGHAGGGAVDRTGRTLAPILGPVLDGGPGVAAISDSDGGRLDGDPTWDRAVGPMQFIPTSWLIHGADGNGDGKRDPHNVRDAALASAGYLCTGDRDLSVERDRRQAVFSYNHSWDYVDLVLAWADAYAHGTPVLAGTLPGVAAGKPDRREAPRAGGAAAEPGAGRRPVPAPMPSLTPGPRAEPAPSPTPRPDGTPGPHPSGPAGEPDRSPEPVPSATPTPSTPEPSHPADPDCASPSPTPSPSGSPSPTETTTPEPPEPPEPPLPTPTPSPTQLEQTPSPSPTVTSSEPCATPEPSG